MVQRLAVADRSSDWLSPNLHHAVPYTIAVRHVFGVVHRTRRFGRFAGPLVLVWRMSRGRVVTATHRCCTLVCTAAAVRATPPVTTGTNQEARGFLQVQVGIRTTAGRLGLTAVPTCSAHACIDPTCLFSGLHCPCTHAQGLACQRESRYGTPRLPRGSASRLGACSGWLCGPPVGSFGWASALTSPACVRRAAAIGATFS